MSTQSGTAAGRKFNFADFHGKYGTIAIFAVIFVASLLLVPNFSRAANLMNVVRQMVVVTLLAFGVTFVIILGHIDVSLGSVLALCGCVAAAAMQSSGSVFLAVMAGLGVGLLSGVINGAIYPDANNDNNKQLDQIDNFIMQEVDCLLVVPVDYAGVSVGIKKANRAGIPVICLGIEAEGGESTFVGSPNLEAGRMQGDFMREKLPQNAKVLYLEGSPGYSHTTERKQGFKEACLDKRPDVTLLASQTGEYEQDRGMKVAEDWIQSFPEFDAIVAANDQMALGALQALKTAGRSGVLISGVDGVEDALRAIKSGDMAQSVLQNAPAQAEAAYKAMKQLLAGETLPKQIIVPFESITGDNIDHYFKE